MLRRPSLRRKSKGTGDIELPLVPIMDAFVTLIAFLLLATSLLSVTLIDTPVPVFSNLPDEPNKDKPLMLTLKLEENQLVLSSGFRKIPTQAFPKIEKPAEPGKANGGMVYDTDKLHEALIAIKTQFPTERNIVFMPVAEVKYDDLIHVMDAVRVLSKTDPSFFYKDKDGVDKPDQLFANVVFGNVISGN